MLFFLKNKLNLDFSHSYRKYSLFAVLYIYTLSRNVVKSSVLYLCVCTGFCLSPLNICWVVYLEIHFQVLKILYPPPKSLIAHQFLFSSTSLTEQVKSLIVERYCTDWRTQIHLENPAYTN